MIFSHLLNALTIERDEMLPFEEPNVEAYRLLLRIEVAVRELLRVSMESQFGPGWRQRLPGELLKIVRDQERDEANRPQFNFQRLGPLYYMTLGELIPLLRQKPGQVALQPVGGQFFLTQLENVLAPRNAIAHARGVSTSGLQCIRALHAQLETALTPAGLSKLISSPDVGLAPEEAVPELVTYLRGARVVVLKLEKPTTCPVIHTRARVQHWWPDNSLAGFDSAAVDRAMDLINEFMSIPDGVGTAGIRQTFLEDRSLVGSIDVALLSLDK